MTVARITGRRATLGVVTLALVVIGGVRYAGPDRHNPSPTPPAAATNAACHVRGDLPDLSCTPGATNPDVTQANVDSTICVAGWSSQARRRYSSSVYARLKVDRMVAYGIPVTTANKQAVELDHDVPISLGGALVDPRNLWPEPDPAPNPKDAVEGKLRAAVCSHQLGLADAQARIARDWHTAVPAGLAVRAPADASD